MSGALAGRVRHAALRAAAAGMRGTALGALVAGGLGLAACTGDTGDGLGGSVRMEWRMPRLASATADTAGSAKPGATPAEKRDTVGAAKRDTTRGAKPNTTGGAGRDTVEGARPSAAPAVRPTPPGANRPAAETRSGAANRPAAENRSGAANNAPGRLVGSMRGRGVVVWCPDPKLAIITGVQGDTGLGLVVHPRDSLLPGTYRVLEPDSARAAAPAAAVALRLMTRSAIEGFQGRSGTLTITEVRNRRFSGTLQAEIEVVGGVPRFDLQGELSGVPIHVGGSACPS